MRAARSAVLLASTAVAALAMPSYAEFQPNNRAESVFFHCSSAQTSKVGNLEGPAAWTTARPAASVQSGAGCGQADVGTGSVTGGGVRINSAQFTGSFTGNLRDLNVRLDSIYAGAGRTAAAVPLTVTLKVDGVDLLGATGKSVSVTSVPSSTKLSEAFSFAVTNLGLQDEANDRQHDVTLTVKATGSAVNAWVYDTTEVPGGIDFNPAALNAARVTR